jgi:hypothetical protein
MKRTRNMVYKPTEESKELFMFAVNNADINVRHVSYAVKNLSKKWKKGVYDAEKAVDLWYYVATEASKAYDIYYGYSFDVTARFTVAVEMEKYYKDWVEEYE